MYILEKSNPIVYFVVRKSLKKGLRIFELVDYKIPFKDDKNFMLILQAVKALTKISGYDGIFTSSTHKFFDDILRRNGFLKYGPPKLIISNIDIGDEETEIQKRNLIYATMIDCP